MEQVQGKNISGREWKEYQPKKTTLANRGSNTKKTLTKTWEQKIKERQEREALKRKENEMKQQKIAKIEEEKKNREEKKRRREENELKNVQYQIITNSKKLKVMSKKQKRQIMKIDVSKDKVI